MVYQATSTKPQSLTAAPFTNCTVVPPGSPLSLQLLLSGHSLDAHTRLTQHPFATSSLPCNTHPVARIRQSPLGANRPNGDRKNSVTKLGE